VLKFDVSAVTEEPASPNTFFMSPTRKRSESQAREAPAVKFDVDMLVASRDAAGILRSLDGAVVGGFLISVIMANKDAIALILGGVRGYAVRQEQGTERDREEREAAEKGLSVMNFLQQTFMQALLTLIHAILTLIHAILTLIHAISTLIHAI